MEGDEAVVMSGEESEEMLRIRSKADDLERRLRTLRENYDRLSDANVALAGEKSAIEEKAAADVAAAQSMAREAVAESERKVADFLSRLKVSESRMRDQDRELEDLRRRLSLADVSLKPLADAREAAERERDSAVRRLVAEQEKARKDFEDLTASHQREAQEASERFTSERSRLLKDAEAALKDRNALSTSLETEKRIAAATLQTAIERGEERASELALENSNLRAKFVESESRMSTEREAALSEEHEAVHAARESADIVAKRNTELERLLREERRKSEELQIRIDAVKPDSDVEGLRSSIADLTAKLGQTRSENKKLRKERDDLQRKVGAVGQAVQ